MNFIKDNKLHVANKISSFVQHRPQNLCRHNQAASLWVDLNVTGENTNGSWIECLFEISELLVGERFDRGSIDRPREDLGHFSKRHFK